MFGLVLPLLPGRGVCPADTEHAKRPLRATLAHLLQGLSNSSLSDVSYVGSREERPVLNGGIVRLRPGRDSAASEECRGPDRTGRGGAIETRHSGPDGTLRAWQRYGGHATPRCATLGHCAIHQTAKPPASSAAFLPLLVFVGGVAPSTPISERHGGEARRSRPSRMCSCRLPHCHTC